MKKLLTFGAIFSLLILSCTKKSTTNNYYSTPGEGGAIVGIVSPAGSNAKVSAYMGIEVASTQIDEKGYYKLTGLPAGTFSLVVQAEGYNEYCSKPYIEVADGATAVADTIFLTSIRDLISSVYPGDGAEGVGLGQQIRISFRRKMDRESAEKAFQIEPPVEGAFSWYERPEHGPFELRYRPDDYFAANTVYEGRIDTTAADTAGIKQYEPYEFSFATEPIRITSTSPRDEETGVSPGTNIYVYFNTYMDAESTVLAFKMVDYELNDVTGEFTWYDLRSMHFNPDLTLDVSETYTVTIDVTASDTKGGRLSEPYEFSFTTEAIGIDYTYPSDNATWVVPNFEIQIYFNTDMDGESVISAFKMVDSGLNEVKGEFSWKNLQRLGFRPNEVLAVSETYTVTIDSTASNTKGTKLSEPYKFSFTTQPLRVTSTKPANQETWVSQHTSVSINFNTSMDIESAVSAFEMVDSQSEPVTGEFTWSELAKMNFYPDLILTPNEKYTVTMGTTAKDIYGASLENAYTFWFKTRSE